MMNNKSILLICNTSNSVINFRKELILRLKEEYNRVIVIASDSDREREILQLGADFFSVPFDNQSTNPISFLKTYKNMVNTISSIQPSIVFTFQIKPNIIGVFAAKKCKIKNIYSMVEGLGEPFQKKGLLGVFMRYIVSLLYKFSSKYIRKLFFLNSDDFNEFIQRKIINKQRGIIIPGIGIDTSKYTPNAAISTKKRVLYLARLMKNKGILEYCKVAKLVKEIDPEIEFELYGQEADLTKEDLLDYIEGKIVYYGGYLMDVKEKINESRIYVSLSRREGFPRTILEAMALGKPVIATNVIGNREAVIDTVTGYLVPLDDLKLFAQKLIDLINNEDELKTLGNNARTLCEQKYDSKLINDEIIKIIEQNISA